jgi:hypothetical protein
MVVSFTVAAGPRQRSRSQVRVPRDSWPQFTVTDSRPPRTWRARPSYLYPAGTWWPGIHPGLDLWVSCQQSATALQARTSWKTMSTQSWEELLKYDSISCLCRAYAVTKNSTNPLFLYTSNTWNCSEPISHCTSPHRRAHQDHPTAFYFISCIQFT